MCTLTNVIKFIFFLVMVYSLEQKAQCVEWFIKQQYDIDSGRIPLSIPTEFQSLYGYHATIPQPVQIKSWYDRFKRGEGMERKKRVSTPKDQIREAVVAEFDYL